MQYDGGIEFDPRKRASAPMLTPDQWYITTPVSEKDTSADPHEASPIPGDPRGMPMVEVSPVTEA